MQPSPIAKIPLPHAGEGGPAAKRWGVRADGSAVEQRTPSPLPSPASGRGGAYIWCTLGASALFLAAAPAHAQDMSPAGIAAKNLREFQAAIIGTFTNEENVYFDKETGQSADPRMGLRIAADGDAALLFTPLDRTDQPSGAPVRSVISQKDGLITLATNACTMSYRRTADAFSAVTPSCSGPGPHLIHVAPGRLTMIDKVGADKAGATMDLRRGRGFTCWLAAPKAQKKADGSTDWFFARNIKIHDQGTQVFLSPDGGGERIGLKLRNVVWPYGNNRPSLTLYIYRGDDAERAVSYSWADPSAVRIGLNLRWMQASCTLDGAEQ
jgi:hypothetical protein